MNRQPRPRNGRRRVLTAGFAAVALVVLAACGSSGAGTTTTADAAASPSATAAFPVAVAHRYGTTTIEEEPTRVAVVGLMEQDALLALGIVPVAATEWFGEYPGAVWPWAQDELGSAAVPEVLSFADGIEFEKVAALNPDLIVGMYSALTKEDYATLSKIAPTLAQPAGSTIDWSASWQQVTSTVGTAVGKSAAAEALIADVEGQIDSHVADNPDFQGKSGLVATPWEGIYVYGSGDPRGLLLQELGFVMPEGLDEVTGQEFGANLSKERTDLLDVDALVWLLDVKETDQAKVLDNPLYTSLDVHTLGRDIFVAGDEDKGYYGATSFITVLSLPMLLEGLVPQLSAAVDGDPATAVPGPPAKS